MIPLEKNRSSRIYFYAAASIAALLLLNSVWMYVQWQSTQDQLEVLRLESENLKTQLAEIESDFEETSKWYAMINDPEVEKHIMTGNSLSPQSVAVAYLNEAEQTGWGEKCQALFPGKPVQVVLRGQKKF